jgi:hypothetical protein
MAGGRSIIAKAPEFGDLEAAPLPLLRAEDRNLSNARNLTGPL